MSMSRFWPGAPEGQQFWIKIPNKYVCEPKKEYIINREEPNLKNFFNPTARSHPKRNVNNANETFFKISHKFV